MGEIDYTTNSEICAISQKQDELSSDDRTEIENFVRDRISEESLNEIKTYVAWNDFDLKTMLVNKELANHYDKIGNIDEAGWHAFSFMNALCNTSHVLALIITDKEKQKKEVTKYHETATKSSTFRVIGNGIFDRWQMQQSENDINQALGGTSLPDHQ